MSGKRNREAQYIFHNKTLSATDNAHAENILKIEYANDFIYLHVS